jgi:hypothetical protein
MKHRPPSGAGSTGLQATTAYRSPAPRRTRRPQGTLPNEPPAGSVVESESPAGDNGALTAPPLAAPGAGDNVAGVRLEVCRDGGGGRNGSRSGMPVNGNSTGSNPPHPIAGQAPSEAIVPMTPHSGVRVLYIGGWGRSGSTLLDLMLGQAPGVFSAGEVREIWQSGLVENRPCGCQRPFRDCPFWKQVGQQGFGGWDKIALREVLGLRYSLDRPWSFPVVPLRSLARPVAARVRTYTAVLERLYEAIAEVSESSIIVDSSNLPSHAFLLNTIPAVDLRVIHLVRDSRGVAFSWRKQVEKERPDGPPAYLPRYSPGASSLRWVLYNGLTQALKSMRVPYVMVRYEDLMRSPHNVIGRALRHAGLTGGAAEPGYIEGHRARLAANHTVEGNPMRFVTGELTIRADEQWRREMTAGERRLVTALTLPLLAAYGYSVNGQRQA